MKLDSVTYDFRLQRWNFYARDGRNAKRIDLSPRDVLDDIARQVGPKPGPMEILLLGGECERKWWKASLGLVSQTVSRYLGVDVPEGACACVVSGDTRGWYAPGHPMERTTND